MIKVLHFVSKMDRAGQETYIMNVFRNIDRQKIEFGFLCTVHQKGDYDQEIQFLHGKIYYDPIVTKGRYKIIRNYFILKKELLKLSSDYQVFEIHTQHAMDAFFAALAAKKAGFKKIIVHSHNSSTLYHPSFHYLFKPILRTLPIIKFACSDSAGRWMFGNADFEVIKNGIDLSSFEFNPNKRDKLRKKYNWTNNVVIGHIGRFNNQKNHEFLVKIFYEFKKLSPNSKLVLIGKGENYPKIKKLVQSLKLNESVQFLGVKENVNEFYQAMDGFVFPSLFEGLPVVLVEAQTSSLPCLVSDSITDEIKISNKICMMSLNESSKKWAYSLYNLLHNSRKRENEEDSLNKSGYNIKDVVKQLERVYIR